MLDLSDNPLDRPTNFDQKQAFMSEGKQARPIPQNTAPNEYNEDEKSSETRFQKATTPTFSKRLSIVKNFESVTPTKKLPSEEERAAQTERTAAKQKFARLYLTDLYERQIKAKVIVTKVLPVKKKFVRRYVRELYTLCLSEVNMYRKAGAPGQITTDKKEKDSADETLKNFEDSFHVTPIRKNSLQSSFMSDSNLEGLLPNTPISGQKLLYRDLEGIKFSPTKTLYSQDYLKQARNELRAYKKDAKLNSRTQASRMFQLETTFRYKEIMNNLPNVEFAMTGKYVKTKDFRVFSESTRKYARGLAELNLERVLMGDGGRRDRANSQNNNRSMVLEEQDIKSIFANCFTEIGSRQTQKKTKEIRFKKGEKSTISLEQRALPKVSKVIEYID